MKNNQENKKCECVCHKKMVLCPKDIGECGIWCNPTHSPQETNPSQEKQKCTKWDCLAHNDGYGLPCNDGYEISTSPPSHTEWTTEFDEKFGDYGSYNPNNLDALETEVKFRLNIKNFIKTHLSLAQEEGYKKGYNDFINHPDRMADRVAFLAGKAEGRTEERNRIREMIEKKFENWIEDANRRDEFGGTGKETAKLIVMDIISLLSSKDTQHEN